MSYFGNEDSLLNSRIDELWFPNYSRDSRANLMSALNLFHHIADDSLFMESIISYLGAILNVFHLVVLTRKSMMTSSTIVIMIGIAISDLMCMIVAIKSNKMMETFMGNNCTSPDSFLKINIDWTITSFRDDFRRCSAWLGVLIALVRYLVLKYSTESSKYSNPHFGLHTNIGALSCSTLLSIVFFFQSEIVFVGYWSPSSLCTESGVNRNETEPVYVLTHSKLFTLSKGLVANIFLFVNGILSKLIPCVLLPVLTVFLIIEMRKAEHSRSNLTVSTRSGRSDRTTTLVIYIAVSFFISELPTGLVYVFQALYDGVPGFVMMTTDITYLCNAIFTANASIHCIICFAMSSQYRDTVRKLFRLNGVKSTSLSVNPTTANSAVSRALGKVD